MTELGRTVKITKNGKERVISVGIMGISDITYYIAFDGVIVGQYGTKAKVNEVLINSKLSELVIS